MILPRTREQKTTPAFTMVELLGVITVIAILAGLTLGGAGAVRRHGAVNQAKAEIAALQSACERYYADNTAYPPDTNCPPSTSFDPNPAKNIYNKSGTVLFTNLLGSTNLSAGPSANQKRYFEPKPSMVSGNYFVDPWGYPYGYYSDGTNAPLIWSTGGQTNSSGTNKWITSWLQT